MRLRTVIASVLILTAAISLILMFIPYLITSSSSKKAEISIYARNAEMLASVLKQKGELYGEITAEKAQLIETAELFEHKDEIHNNEHDNFLNSITGIQFMILMGRDYSEYSSVYANEFSPYAEELIRVIKKNKINIENLAFGHNKFIILNMPSAGMPVLLSAAPVSGSQNKPAAGFLMVGHTLDKSFIASLFLPLGYEAGVARSTLETTPEYKNEGNNFIRTVEILSRDAAKIGIIVKDAEGKPIVSIIFPIKRTINIFIEDALNESLLIFSVLTVLVFISVLLFLFKFVIRPAEELSISSDEMANGKSITKYVPVDSPSEFGLIETSMMKLADRHLKMEKDIVEISKTDQLTGILTKRYFDEIFLYEWNLAKRTGHYIGLMIADLDEFKLFNDTYGYSTGDKCLADIAAIIKKTLKRTTDIVARYGGEEFVILLPDSDMNGTGKIASEILNSVQQAEICHATSQKKIVTLSIGYCSMIPELSDTKEKLMLEADKALYEAKKTRGIIYPKYEADPEK